MQWGFLLRKRLGLPAASCFTTIVLFATWTRRADLRLPTEIKHWQSGDEVVFPDAHAHAWMRLSAILEKHKPNCPGLEKKQNALAAYFSVNNHTVLPEILPIPGTSVESMRQAHTAFLADISTQTTPFLSYATSSRGIVTTAGGRYLPIVIISIRMLRRTGCELPIEVFLLTADEYESYTCETILPSLGAKCLLLDDVLRSAPPNGAQSWKINRFALKSLALTFSSFEHNLFLDADCFPLHDPDVLFKSDPYTSKGMVTWPDFWRSTISPKYFKIATMIPTDPALRPTTEAGEMLISRKTHERTILLALYYNLYGPEYYYPIFSQGAIGEGDKETVLNAALAVGQPFHAVNEPVRAVGHSRRDLGNAMVQYDPIEDYARTRNGLPANFDGDTKKPTSARPFFVHANLPKHDPATIFNDDYFQPVRAPDGNFWRCWIDPTETVKSLGGDIERQFWKEMKLVACEFETRFKSWEGKQGICANVTNYFYAVFEGRREGLQTM